MFGQNIFNTCTCVSHFTGEETQLYTLIKQQCKPQICTLIQENKKKQQPQSQQSRNI